MAVLVNPKHELFAQQRARGVQSTLAARRAGYLAAEHGYWLSKQPEIVARINELLEAAAADTVMEANEILQGLTIMARGDLRDVFDLEAVRKDYYGNPINDAKGQPIPDIVLLHPKEWTNEAAAAITSLEFDKDGRPKVKSIDRLKAYEMLGRARGMFKDNVALTGANGGPIETINADMPPEQAAALYQATLGK